MTPSNRLRTKLTLAAFSLTALLHPSLGMAAAKPLPPAPHTPTVRAAEPAGSILENAPAVAEVASPAAVTPLIAAPAAVNAPPPGPPPPPGKKKPKPNKRPKPPKASK